jgi:Na+-driven multidrug efflux pump
MRAIWIGLVGSMIGGIVARLFLQSWGRTRRKLLAQPFSSIIRAVFDPLLKSWHQGLHNYAQNLTASKKLIAISLVMTKIKHPHQWRH